MPDETAIWGWPFSFLIHVLNVPEWWLYYLFDEYLHTEEWKKYATESGTKMYCETGDVLQILLSFRRQEREGSITATTAENENIFQTEKHRE